MKNNQVILAGRMVSNFELYYEGFGEKFYQAFISVGSDILPIIAPGSLLDAKDEYIDTFVMVKGQCRTCNKDINNKKSLLINVFTTNFSQLDVLNEQNNVCFCGFICKKPYLIDGKYNFILAVNRNYGKSDYIPCVYNGSMPFDMGDEVCVQGAMHSREYYKIINGVATTQTAYEVVLSDIKRR